MTSGSTVRRSRTNCCARPRAPRCPPSGGSGAGSARLSPMNLRLELGGDVLDGDHGAGSGCAGARRTSPRSRGRAGPAGSSARAPPSRGRRSCEQVDRTATVLLADEPRPRRAACPRLRRHHVEAALDVWRAPRAGGRGRPGSSRPTRIGGDQGGEALDDARSSRAGRRGSPAAPSPRRRPTASFSKASCFCRSSSRVEAEASALKPERPGGGEDAPLPRHGLRALGLQVEQVVVEAARRAAPRWRAPSPPRTTIEHGAG